ncbi:MAG: LLM class F420-dependent oxidoreductase [Acidimicrobiales bacterium]
MDLRIFIEPQQGASYDDQLAVARTAEDEGFGAFFRSDHYLGMGSVDGRPGPTDSWVTLGALARDTSTIRLGTMVTSATFRLPGPLAIAVAQVDQMSGGRVELGIGTGWYEAEHTAYGIPFPGVVERFDRLEEQLAIITGLWETAVGDTFSFAGRYYTLTDAPGLPKPAQSPHPPLILGGGARRRSAALAARFANEYNVGFVDPEAAAVRVGRVRTACEAAGRDPDDVLTSIAVSVCCGRDRAEVERRARAIGRDPNNWGDSDLGGSPDEVVDRLHDYAAAGIGRAYLQVLDLGDLDHIRLIAERVAPTVDGF